MENVQRGIGPLELFWICDMHIVYFDAEGCGLWHHLDAMKLRETFEFKSLPKNLFFFFFF